MTLSVQIDWSKDGTWTTTGDDVSARVLPVTAAVTASYGRDQSTSLTPVSSGRGSLVLDNSSRDYSPRNASSPLYGKLKPARPVRVRRTVGATTYTLLVAHTDTSPINPDVEAKSVSLTLADSLADFRGQAISTPLYMGVRTGTAVGYVLDAIGWTGGRDLDVGGSVLPWWWEEGTDAYQALQNLLAAEGPPALLTVGSSGEIVYRDRHHRLVRSASTTSQGTWRGDGVVEPTMQRPFSYDEAWQNVINSASISVPIRQQAPLAVVWSSTDVIDLTAGQVVQVKAVGSDPFTGAVVPVLGDITTTAASSTVTASLDRTSGGAVTISLTTTGTARVTALQLRANPVQVANTVVVSLQDASSVADYGVRSHPDIPFASVKDVTAIVNATLAIRAQPLPVISVTFQVGGTSSAQLARAAAVLGLDLSDRVTVIEPETQLSADFFVESIAHSLTGDENHTVTIGLEAAPTQPTLVFILGSATRGVLGTNKLGKQGLDDPATVFVLGTSLLGTGLLGH